MINNNLKNRLNIIKTMLFVVAILWIILLISSIFPFIKGFGIVPRHFYSLPFILTAPFLHVNLSHLIANSLSLLILGSILIGSEGRRSISITANLIVWGGLGTWIIGRSSSVHIGASGVIYGYIGYLLSYGIFNRDVKTILISILVLFLYGGAVWGVFPTNSAISWEGHACGFVVGIVLAKGFSMSGKKAE